MSMIANGQFLATSWGEGIPGCRGPKSSITLLTFLRSRNNLHLSLPCFLITETEVFQGLLEQCGLWITVPLPVSLVHAILLQVRATDGPKLDGPTSS